MRAHLRDRHTPWVSLLCAVVAMVRRDDCLVQLNDAEEAEQRALEGRPDGATRCWLGYKEEALSKYECAGQVLATVANVS